MLMTDSGCSFVHRYNRRIKLSLRSVGSPPVIQIWGTCLPWSKSSIFSACCRSSGACFWGGCGHMRQLQLQASVSMSEFCRESFSQRTIAVPLSLRQTISPSLTWSKSSACQSVSGCRNVPFSPLVMHPAYPRQPMSKCGVTRMALLRA